MAPREFELIAEEGQLDAADIDDLPFMGFFVLDGDSDWTGDLMMPSVSATLEGPVPTVLALGAIWAREEVVACSSAVCRKSREFCDTDTTLGFLGVSVSRNSDAKPLTCAKCFATS